MSRDGTGAPSIRQSKAKKRGRRLIRPVSFLLLALMIIITVCGVLYIREHLPPAPDSESPDGNMEPGGPALSGPPIVPIETAVPGNSTIPDRVIQDSKKINPYLRVLF